MIETIAAMPAGTYGFRASGKLSHSDYVEVMIPPLRAAIDRGEKVRMLYQLGPGFHGIAAGALWDDVQADITLGLGHLSAWERTALVSDEGWLSHVAATIGWLIPGEMQTFSLDQLDAAKRWLTR
jgi:stage II sporulation SpoAA-like protein